MAFGYTDMRKGIDGLAMLVQGVLRQDPFSGHLFVFRGRKANLIKIVFWDGTGLCLFTKRLEQGVFLWPSNVDPGGTLALSSVRNDAALKLHNLLLCAWTNYMIRKRVKGLRMSESVSLRDVPGRFLDQCKWRALREFTSQELIALTYINAPYPDEENEDEIRCYHTGRSLLQQCRYLLNAGQLVASGIDRSSGKRTTISASEWVNLWPMFATNTAAGPDQAFDDISVFQAEHRNTFHEKLCSECIAWLKEQRTAGLGEKKTTLYEYARHRFGNSLTHAIFDAAYLSAFARRRGRPKKSSI